MRTLLAITLTAALAGPALAANAPPDASFTTAVKACARIAQGKLSLNPPNPAQAASGIVLADPVAADELAAFHDLSATRRIMGAVPAAGPGVVAVAADDSQRLCRVVVWDASPTQLAEVKKALTRMQAYWHVGAVAAGVSNFTSEDGLAVRVRQPKAGAGWGKAQLMVSFVKPVG